MKKPYYIQHYNNVWFIVLSDYPLHFSKVPIFFALYQS